MPDFRRKKIRLSPERYRGKQWYFLTACCVHRREFFTDHDLALSVVDILGTTAEERGLAVYAYCLMPDHVHLLACGMRDESNVLDFMKEFKHRTGQLAWRAGRRHLWQTRFYDHILRRSDAVDAVAAYIWMNPVRKGLCKRSEDYPFSGSFALDWEAVRRIGQSIATWTPSWKKSS